MITTTPTWELILNCARALTAEGKIPFTRKQLIECVCLKDPARLPGTINPVTQGMTVNLKGGPAGRGRGALRSVGRGQFVFTAPSDHIPDTRTKALAPRPPAQDQAVALDQYQISEVAGLEFQRICALEPERDADGSVRIFEPQSRYANQACLMLNRYGTGPFCRFRIPPDLPLSGVYAITRGSTPLYVGECENLSRRFNTGYGQISPRNCFQGGQETNCRINVLVLKEMQAGRALHLYFHPCDNYKQLEAMLRRDLMPQWNRI